MFVFKIVFTIRFENYEEGGFALVANPSSVHHRLLGSVTGLYGKLVEGDNCGS